MWYNKDLYNTNYGKYKLDNNKNSDKYRPYQSTSNDAPFLHKSLDPVHIKQELNARIKDLAYQFLGKPNQQKPTEWRYGSKGSVSIQVAGHKQGLYSNFETGEFGSALKFIQDQLNCDYKQAFKWGMDWLGQNHQNQLDTLTRAAIEKVQPLHHVKQEWTPIFPAPSQSFDLRAEKQLAYMFKGRQETARYTYKDADENILGYVVRLEDKHGHKITPTLTYCRNKDGQEQWRWNGFGDHRPLYGLEQLKKKPDAPVLVVEGEKTCEAARALLASAKLSSEAGLSDYAVVTWSGGCGAVQKSDWSVLKGKHVTVWPDNDQPGLNAAVKVANMLKEQGHQAVNIVDLPSTLPYKWDLADKIPDGLEVREILANSLTQRTAQEIRHPNALPLTDEQQKDQSIIKYLEAQLTSKDNRFWVDAKIDSLIRFSMAENPQDALKAWQYITNSYNCSFIPMTFAEMQRKTQEANGLLESQKSSMEEDTYAKLKETMATNPQEVIQHFRMVHMQQDVDRNADIRKFTNLAKEYSQMPSYERNEDNAITKQLTELSSKYLHDEKFNTALASNDLTKSVQKSLSENKMEEQKTMEVYRGFER